MRKSVAFLALSWSILAMSTALVLCYLQQFLPSLPALLPGHEVIPWNTLIHDIQWVQLLIISACLLSALAVGVAYWIDRENSLQSKEMKRSIQTSESVLRATLLAAKGTAYYTLDARGVIESWSESAEAMLGFSTAEMVGLPYSSLLNLQPHYREKAQEMLRQTAAQGIYKEKSFRACKYRRFFSADITLCALEDDEGRLIGYVEILRDATDALNGERSAATGVMTKGDDLRDVTVPSMGSGV